MRSRAAATQILLASLLLLPLNPALRAEDGWSGTLTPKLLFFDYTGGPGDHRNHVLELFQVRDGISGDERGGLDLDVDFDLAYARGSRRLFTLERRGDGRYNNVTSGRFDAGKVAISAYHSRYRSAVGGLDYLYSPNQVPGGTDPSYNTPAQTSSGYLARFNDDSARTTFRSDRTAFGAKLRLKPALLANRASIDLLYDGYQRDGAWFAPWIAGGSDFAGTSPQLQRWRGYDQPIDEDMGRLSLGLTLSPGGSFHLAYAGAVEEFDNQARSFTMGSFASRLPSGNSVSGTNGTKPLHFVPDSQLTTHRLRLTKSMGRSTVAAGYAVSLLEQDSFTERQRAALYRRGEISGENAFLHFNSRLAKTVSLQARLQYLKRDNDSTFPATGLISATADQQLGVRINSLETFEYGLEAAFRPGKSRTTLTAGWTREDTRRDLTFHVSPGITAQRSLYGEESLSDEVYLKFSSRPVQGLTLRITPSYAWAGDTGLVLEPEDSFELKAFMSYLTPQGAMVSGYYNYRDAQNDSLTYTNAVAPTGADGTSVAQDVAQALQSAGAAWTLSPGAGGNYTLGLDWMQRDFESYYFSTNRRRFENPTGGITFTRRDRSKYKVDTLALSLAGAWQPSEALSINAGYTHSESQGDVASGLIATELRSTLDGAIDSILQSFLLGVSYEPTKRMGYWLQYTFDDYQDDSYDLLSGSLHTVTLGFAFKI